MNKDTKKRAAPGSDLSSPPPRKRASIITLKERLEQACANENPKGWRALELGFHPRKGRRSLEFRTAFFSDLTELQGCRSSRREKKQRGEHGKFSSSESIIDPLSNYYLTYSWGVGKNYAAEMTKTKRITGSVGASITEKKAAPEHAQLQQQQVQEKANFGSHRAVKDPPVVEHVIGMGSNVAAAAAAARSVGANSATGQATQPSTPTDEKFTQLARDTRTLFEKAHEHKIGKGWRARQKGLSAVHCSREFQQESLRDLVVMRGCLPDHAVYASNGPACLDNIAFAWNVDRNHFQKLFQGKRAASNQDLAETLARACNNMPTSTALSTQPTTATNSSPTMPLSLVHRLLAKKPKNPQKPPPPKALKDILAAGCALQKTKGWRAQELGFPNGKVGRLHEFRNAFLLDLAELRGYMSAIDSNHNRGSNGKFTKNEKNVHDPFTISYLNYAWGVGRNYANSLMNPEPQRERMRQQRKKGKQEESKALQESAEEKSKARNQNDMTDEASI